MSLLAEAEALSPNAYGRAGRLYERAFQVETADAFGEDVSEQDYDDALAAQRHLEEKFGNSIRSAATDPQDWIDSHKSRRRLEHDVDRRNQKRARQRGERHEQDERRRRREQEPSEERPSSPQPARAARRSGRRGGLLTGRTHPAAEATGLPLAARSATSNVLFALGSLIALALLYDVTTYTRTPALFLGSLSGFLDRLVKPVDPLTPFGGGPPTATPGGAAAASPTLGVSFGAAIGAAAPKLGSSIGTAIGRGGSSAHRTHNRRAAPLFARPPRGPKTPLGMYGPGGVAGVMAGRGATQPATG